MDQIKVKDIMRKDVITIDHKLKISDTVNLMVSNNIGSIVITKSQKAIGIITKKDLLIKVLSKCKNPCEIFIESIFKPKLITVYSNETIKKAFHIMLSNNIKRLPVLESDLNNLVGIISLHDILSAFQTPFMDVKSTNQLYIKHIKKYNKE